jgi:hypothetical protein
MKNLLPFVTNEVGCSVAQSLSNDDKKNCITQLKRIKKTNPAIAEFIQKWASYCENKEEKIRTVMCGVLVYRLLESQAEADLMNEQFGA